MKTLHILLLFNFLSVATRPGFSFSPSTWLKRVSKREIYYMLPDYEVLLLRDALIIIFPSEVLQQIFEAPNVPSSHQLIRSHRQTDEQDETEPTVKQSKEQAVPLPAQYHSQHIRCHDAKSNLENFVLY